MPRDKNLFGLFALRRVPAYSADSGSTTRVVVYLYTIENGDIYCRRLYRKMLWS